MSRLRLTVVRSQAIIRTGSTMSLGNAGFVSFFCITPPPPAAFWPSLSEHEKHDTALLTITHVINPLVGPFFVTSTLLTWKTWYSSSFYHTRYSLLGGAFFRETWKWVYCLSLYAVQCHIHCPCLEFILVVYSCSYCPCPKFVPLRCTLAQIQ